MMRSVGITILTALVGVVVFSGSAGAINTMDITWIATTGGGSTGGSTIEAENGDILTAEVTIAIDAAGLTAYSVSLEFDTAFDDELDVISATGFVLPGFFGGGDNPTVRQESTLIQEGQIYAFSNLCNSCTGPSNTTIVIGEVEFEVVDVASDGDDVFSGMFFVGVDGYADNANNLILSGTFNNAVVNAPEPSAVTALSETATITLIACLASFGVFLLWWRRGTTTT